MMKTYDFFTLTGLSFDPPDKSQKRVEKAISEAVFKISSQLGCESQQYYYAFADSRFLLYSSNASSG